MPFRDKFEKIKKFLGICLMPFSISIFLVSLCINVAHIQIRYFNQHSILYIGINFGFLAFLLWFKKLNKQNTFKKIITEFCSSLFLITLLFIAVLNFGLFKRFNLPDQTNLLLTLISTFTGIITLYSYSQKIHPSDIQTGQIEELKIEQSRYIDFDQKFPRINKIPILKTIVRGFYKEGWFYSLSLMLVTSLFLIFGLNHLGKFMSVDEPKWVETRVPQLFEALKNQNWANTYINDKPGILPAFLSGTVNIFLDHNSYKSSPLQYEQYLFWWRLPILIFNFLMLFFIYHFTKKLLNKDSALLTTGLIALNPVVIGISQIVNPDATLWSVGFLSFITFFLYLKTNNKKYLYYSGLFLGLSLISKYFASILYITFFLTIYLEYLFNKISRNQLFKRYTDILILFGISIFTYTVLFPATWVNPLQIFSGTIGSSILEPGIKYLALFFFLIFAELILFKEKITNYLKNKLSIEKILVYIFSLTFSLIFVAFLINILLDNKFFDFNKYVFFEFERRGVSIFQNIISSLYITILTFTLPLLVGLFGFTVILFSKKYYKVINYNLLTVSIFSFLSIFIIGSSLGGFITLTRYQILFYPICSLICSILFLNLFKNKKVIYTVLFFISLTSLISSSPYYYHYTNLLNIKNYTTTEAWGFGGYELSQIINKLSDSRNITVWSDREGFNEFFIGNHYWRAKENPFDINNKVDYLVLTNGGERIFEMASNRYNQGAKDFYALLSKETPLLEYYKVTPEHKVCINKNPNNCIWIVKMKD